MLRFAIITDIHGNAPALEAVLQDISQQGTRRIVCLGDAVGIGPDSNRVLELLAAWPDIALVSGNHDLALVAASRKEPPPPGNAAERAHHEWLAERIRPEYVEWISRWPLAITETAGEVKMLFTHYHAGEHEQELFAPVDVNPSLAGLEQRYANERYGLVAFGHHHVVHHFVSPSAVYINPGSLGCPHGPEPVARYGIVSVADGQVHTELRVIPYDNKAFLRSYKELDVPDAEHILRIFHGAGPE
ncbi:metallophosphoesterase family protein [Paenibacillus tengchongensis]|uniref:metallophosphoesterase family protein n=1 Tax=Paenibacillus tengchongensis TaxID=2608684 RepID=UPI001652397E|nr:metallophosphoesterase family protein [Paenibacillus tengchongensis]